VNNLKVLISVREISELAFSYYNYRCYEGYDLDCSSLPAPNSIGPWKESRSLENFTKLVKDRENGRWIRGFMFIKPNINIYRSFIGTIYSILEQDQVFVLKQEDLRDNPEQTLKEVSSFLNIRYDDFPQKAIHIRSNTRGKPNQVIEHNIKTSTTTDMPEYTKNVLGRFWNEECKYLRDVHNIKYENCL